MPQNILFSKVYMHLKYPRKKTKFALKLASVFHRAVLTNGHVPRVPGFFLNGVVPCTEYSDGQEKERKSGAMQLRIHAKASTHKCADKVHISLWTLYPHESVEINCVENWSACMWK